MLLFCLLCLAFTLHFLEPGFVFKIIYNPFVVLFVMICILMNTATMALDHHNMERELEMFLRTANYVSCPIADEIGHPQHSTHSHSFYILSYHLIQLCHHSYFYERESPSCNHHHQKYVYIRVYYLKMTNVLYSLIKLKHFHLVYALNNAKLVYIEKLKRQINSLCQFGKETMKRLEVVADGGRGAVGEHREKEKGEEKRRENKPTAKLQRTNKTNKTHECKHTHTMPAKFEC